ncbi:hypothetical protein FQN57_000205 [Myotisia sp. PD_48]|nr:hypothetical protein FQN57_000205 [Myotisia sp. PD_48]
MSLYFDAVSVLSGPANAGSLKSRIYNAQWKASPAQIYALIIETSKYNLVLKEIIDNSGILAQEPKKGISAPSNHYLRLAVQRHRTRLNAECTKLRVRRGCASIQALKDLLERELQSSTPFAPRWVRVNNAATTIDQELKTTFSAYSPVPSLEELSAAPKNMYYLDENIPDLLAIGMDSDIISTSSYKEGRLILQDKASCFPAYFLLGDDPGSWVGDLIDGCAAPGNKTTHMASLLFSDKSKKLNNKIFSLDASRKRSKILQDMVSKAGVKDCVNIMAGQDFLALDTHSSKFEAVTGLLLDPSCSGSGISKREDIPQLKLPLTKNELVSSQAPNGSKSRKRKRDQKNDGPTSNPPLSGAPEPTPIEDKLDSDRLTKLANIQCQIVEHAFKFPAATRVTYSTCSIYHEENEEVVSRVLASPIAKSRGWKLLPRADQPKGLRKWEHRGTPATPSDTATSPPLTEAELESCIRCWPNDKEGTGGFFVAAFTREANDEDEAHIEVASNMRNGKHKKDQNSESSEEEEWEGFSSS